MSLTRLDIEKYKSTRNEAEKNMLEMNVIDDSFENDALEGWSNQNISIEKLEQLDKRFNISRSQVYFNASLIIVSLLVILGSIYVLLKDEQTSNRKISQEFKAAKEVNSLPNITEKPINNIQTEEIIKPKTVRNDFIAKAAFDSVQDVSYSEEKTELLKLPLKKVKIEEFISGYRTNIGKETYIENLKVIDYRYYRSRPAEKIAAPTSGTPAENENKYSSGKDDKLFVEISYVSCLEKSLKLFNSLKYKEALYQFERILETYPDDINALFYSSLCFFNLNQFQSCESQLKKLENARFTNFDQEQQWYLLLTYKAEKKKEPFEKTRNVIITEKGYYAKEAANLSF
jgi:hypothetical protein